MSETVEVTLGGPPSTRKTPETTRLDGRFWRIPLGEEGKPPPVHETAVPWAEALWRCWRPLRRRRRFRRGRRCHKHLRHRRFRRGRLTRPVLSR